MIDIDEEMQRLENGYRAGNGFSNLDLANENTQEPAAADTDMLSCYLNEPTNAPERELALMDNVSEFVAIYDKFQHDGIGFLNKFTALLEEKLGDLI